MLDIKWIEENPEAFNKAMEARGNPQRAEEIILLRQIQKIDRQILQIKQEQKNDDTKLFVKLKNEGFEPEEIKNFINSLGKDHD